ncbi:hypothetical protein NIES4071_73410 [Calothrix sp. NIES-4071]|nr:hypothetical protein NIES4071_73410 [Calothrix sp. NIES-4071]BAZ61616.1 hypothetical protein NIES4105_73360 [Calothrix sp. NIES-4105]
MSEPKKYQPTPEQIAKWKRIEELDRTAFAGLFSEEEHREKVKEFLARDYVKDQLEKVRAHKKKLLEKLAWDEDYEQMLLEELERRNGS